MAYTEDSKVYDRLSSLPLVIGHSELIAQQGYLQEVKRILT
ncbi:MAG: hypothetical protein ACP6IQ_11050 [Candidatus Njordarchaeia archaeon]